MGGFDVAVIGVRDVPLLGDGDDLAMTLLTAMDGRGQHLAEGDVVVVASTAVSKVEGRFFDLATVEPGPRALELAATVGKDPRLVELVLRESSQVVRAVPGVLLVRHRLGFVSANAGIDFSNVAGPGEVGVLLPDDPDGAAARLRAELRRLAVVDHLGVVVADTHGRAFRKGNVNVAIGASGLPPLVDERGGKDLYGRTLEATVVPLADLAAAAAGLVTGEADEGIPAAIVRGLHFPTSEEGAGSMAWPRESDLFAG